MKPNYIAIDTETTLIPEQSRSPVGGYLSPLIVPDIVCGSMAADGVSWCVSPDHLVDEIRNLDPTAHLVFHNCAFDIPAITKFAPDLHDVFVRLVDEHRIHDCMLMEVLLAIARGHARPDGKPITVYDSLDKLERAYGVSNRVKNADTDQIRLAFGQYLGRFDDIPPHFREYAKEDAAATLGVWNAQLARARAFELDAVSKWPTWGVLNESTQIMGALALRKVQRTGIRVDLPTVQAKDAELAAEAAHLEALLVRLGFAKLTPKTRKFSVSQKTLRAALRDFAAEHNITLGDNAYSDSGLLTLSYDHWADHVPRIDPFPIVDTNDPVEKKVGAYMRYQKVRMLRRRYTLVFSAGEWHYPVYSVLGARTGRTAARAPAIQQVPRRRDSLRSFFIAPEGRVFIEGDLSAAELAALGQVQIDRFGESRIGKLYNAGADLHTETARGLVPGFDALPPEEKKRWRDASKAVNFGLPGGLGAARFRSYAKNSFGLVLDVPAAKALRDAALSADPQLAAYLDESYSSFYEAVALAASNLCVPPTVLRDQLGVESFDEDTDDSWRKAYWKLRDWQRGIIPAPACAPSGFDPKRHLWLRTVTTRNGLVRGRASYTEQRNTPFQALVADAIKIALWDLYKISNTFDLQIHATLHDSVLVSVPDNPQSITEGETLVKKSLEAAGLKTCPDVPIRAEVKVLGHTWAGAVSQNPATEHHVQV